MQLTKLLTLSQFIDQCDGLSEPCYSEIAKYNNFLKQPLIKEMFVNENKKPECYLIYQMQYFECSSDEIYRCKKWDKEEKKVIFNDDKVFVDKNYPDGIRIVKKGLIPFGWPLSDLADATKGTLTLKNVEL